MTRKHASAALAGFAILFVGVFAGRALGVAPSQADFPDGYDAVAAAPGSHRVVFENALVRVLEVTMPPPGKVEPMHHHHWPSFFLEWDTGGKSPHIRYHQPGGKVREMQSESTASHPGRW